MRPTIASAGWTVGSSRAAAVIERALQGGKQLTRSELASALRRAGIHADGMRLTYLMMRAELDAVMCSGARRGKQFTYALVAERAPDARTLERDEALAALTRRYFASRGPATLRDYSWWSGLKASAVRRRFSEGGKARATGFETDCRL